MTIDRQCRLLIRRHGGVRAAARALRMDAGYLSRLANRQKVHPSKATLRKLGLREIITYEATR